MLKLLLVAGLALALFTEGMSLFLCLVAIVGMGLDYAWSRVKEEETPYEQQTI